MLDLLLKLLIAHFLGDFLLQPSKWVTNKLQSGLQAPQFYLHIGVHLLLMVLLLNRHMADYWQGIMVVTVSHFIIDALKIYAEKRWPSQKFILFCGDQAAHIFVIGLVTYYYIEDPAFAYLWGTKALIYLLGLLLVFSVSPIFIRAFFSKWEHLLKTKEDDDFITGNDFRTETLKDAGKIIGILERLLIVLFILLDFWGGIGFLLAAKSVFRFGTLNNAKEKKLTEYILMGTLISFTSAIVIGLILKLLLRLT